MKRWKQGIISCWLVGLAFWVMSTNAGPGATNVFPPEFVRLSKIGAFVLPIVLVAGMVREFLNNGRR